MASLATKSMQPFKRCSTADAQSSFLFSQIRRRFPLQVIVSIWIISELFGCFGSWTANFPQMRQHSFQAKVSKESMINNSYLTVSFSYLTLLVYGYMEITRRTKILQTEMCILLTTSKSIFSQHFLANNNGWTCNCDIKSH